MPERATDLYEPIPNAPSGSFIVHSKSGATYIITNGMCTCPGYGYRGQCRHITNAPTQPTTVELYVNLPRPQPNKHINEQWINDMAYRLTHNTH